MDETIKMIEKMISHWDKKKRCKICGVVFFPKNYRQIICSNECKKKRKNALRRKPKKYCILCGTETKGFICSGAECQKTYHQVYCWTQNRMKLNIRASGKKYENLPEKIQALKEKYKNGISVETIKQMME